MSEQDERPTPPPSLRPSRRELRASLLLPVAITLAIWLVGLLVYALTPREFDTWVALAIGGGLLLFLVFWTRRASREVRLLAVLMALPALAGITLGMISGRASDTIIGVGLTFLLLVAQRLLSVPVSYRVAYRQFQAGDLEQALALINKSIAARPGYWQSYQLRALIHLSYLHFIHAEQDARRAIELQPAAHPVYNTLGQIHLAQGQFSQAADAYAEAVRLAPAHALYHYHLGLSQYRLGHYGEAADSLAAATQGTLPLVTYDLLVHYYLGRSLEALGRPELAQEVFEAAAKFGAGLEALQEQYAQLPEHPHLELLRRDLEAMKRVVFDGMKEGGGK